MLPRGIPKPAELLLMTRRLEVLAPIVTGALLRPTAMRLRDGLVGTSGVWKPRGGLITLGVLVRPIQLPPGCHAHP